MSVNGTNRDNRDSSFWDDVESLDGRNKSKSKESSAKKIQKFKKFKNNSTKNFSDIMLKNSYLNTAPIKDLLQKFRNSKEKSRSQYIKSNSEVRSEIYYNDRNSSSKTPKKKSKNRVRSAIKSSIRLYELSLNNNINQKSVITNRNRRTSEELRELEELKNCTFAPKISEIKDKILQNKLDNYSKLDIYERGKIFTQKLNENKFNSKLQQKITVKNSCIFKPKINNNKNNLNKIFHDSNKQKQLYQDLGNQFYYKRILKSRINKINQERSCLTDRTNYFQNNDIVAEEKNIINRYLVNKKNININCKSNYNYNRNNYNNNFSSIVKNLTQKQCERYMKNLHSCLINSNTDKLNEDDFDYNFMDV